MNICEYEKVMNLNYLEYCDYLQKKYGVGLCDYMTPNWVKKRGVTRTKDGLYVHHQFEDHAIKLSDPAYAKKNPYEWQMKENLVYCDLLEHLFLHILICEKSNIKDDVGIGGIICCLVPELNDIYSGWVSSRTWQITCHNVVIKDKEVYLELIKRIKQLQIFDANNHFFIKELQKSYMVTG